MANVRFIRALLVLARHSLYLIILGLFSLFERICRYLGIGPKPYSADHCEIRNILWRSRISHGELYFNVNFLTSRNKFVDSKYVLRNTVLPYSFTKTHVTFVEFEKPVHEECTIEKSVILMNWAFENAKRFLRVPIDSFEKMVDEELGKKMKTKVIFMGNSARCGSTLMCKVVGGYCPGLICMSEPGYVIALGQIKRTMEKEQFQKLASAVVRFGCRPAPGVEGYFIKMTSMGMIIMDQLSPALPELKFFYLERESTENFIMSLYVTLSSISITWLMRYMVVGKLWKPIEMMLGSPPHHVWAKPKQYSDVLQVLNLYECAVFQWSLTQTIVDYLGNVLPKFPTVTYEQLLQKPEQTLTTIVEYCEIKPPYNLDLAMKGFEGDSQEGTHLSRKNLAKILRPEITVEVQERVNKYAKLCGLKPVFRNHFIQK